jgi:hypothetical protein
MNRKYFSGFGVGIYMLGLTGMAHATSIIITGVVDGPLTGGTPKAVEFYILNDIPDLSIYGFGSANNGGGSDGQEFTFTATSALAGDFLYIASESTGFSNFFGFSPDFVNSAAAINGDDAIELFKNGSIVDVFGNISVDGTGQPWEYTDGWGYRNDSTGGVDSTVFTVSDWYFSSPNSLDGETSNLTAATSFPLGTYSSDSSFSPTPTPEPGTMLLFGTGCVCLAGKRKRRKYKQK